MNLLKCILVLLGIFTFNSCSNWEYNKVIHNIPFEKIRYETSQKDTIVIIGFLKNPTEIDGIPVAEDWVHFTPKFELKLFRLQLATNIDKFQYPANTWIVNRNKEFIVCVFPEDTTIQGMKVRGGGGSKGIQSTFYKSGKLRSFFAPDDIHIVGIPCAGTVFAQIYLHENGKLKEALLSEDITIQSKNLHKGTTIKLDINGIIF